MHLTSLIIACLASEALLSPMWAGPRITDIVNDENVRPNRPVGYGLVVGLTGTGDRIHNSQ
jgi:flagellar P-ring protein precursor FlgI